MYETENKCNYYIFKCLFPGCQEIIPVESCISSTTPSMGMSYLQNKGVELIHDLITTDVACPYCSQTNHFSMKDMIKPINRKEYEDQNHAVKSKMSLMRVINKLLQS